MPRTPRPQDGSCDRSNQTDRGMGATDAYLYSSVLFVYSEGAGLAWLKSEGKENELLFQVDIVYGLANSHAESPFEAANHF